MVELATVSDTMDDRAAALTVQLLGGFRIVHKGEEVPESAWRLQKAKSLIKLLALSPGRRLARDRAVDLLWPDLDPEAANNNLYQTLHNVRRALAASGAEVKVSLRHGIVALEPAERVRVDVDVFETAAAAARRSDDVGLYSRALDLYTGDLLPADLYEDFVTWRREGLRETHVALLTEVARRYEARGQVSQAIEAWRQAILADPLREEAHVELMRLYASTGQRSRALVQFEALKQALANELNTEPDERTIRIRQAIVEGQYGSEEEAEEPGQGAARHNLPLSLTSFVDRQQELGELKRLLHANRLVSVLGAGGTGKTRLALRAGWDSLDTYRDGVWLVRLAALRNPDLLAGTVAGVLGVGERTDPNRALLDRLANSEILLILDNCEHLIDACRQLVFRLLSRCPELHILVTSRSRLGLMGEVSLHVPPLSHPPPDDEDSESIKRFEAVQLFLERARYRQPLFSLNPQTAGGVARICNRVEGIPLALELAASRVGLLGVDQIAERLTRSEDLLETSERSEDERHHSLRTTLDWSYRLLNRDEQRALRCFAVFTGGCLVEQAEAVIGCESETEKSALETISRLADQSLITVEGASEGAVRYRLLQPVKQYALSKLREAGEEAETRRRHASVYEEFAAPAYEELRRANARLWLDRLENEHGNLRAAIRWAVETKELEVGLRIVGAIWRFWVNRGHADEGRELTASLLRCSGELVTVDKRVLANAYNAAGSLAYYQTDTAQAQLLYERSLSLRRETGDERGAAATLSNLGLVAKDRGEHDRARELFGEALTLSRRLGDKRGIASTVGNLGILLQERGDFDAARPLLEESLMLAQDEGRTGTVVTSMNNLAELALEQKDYGRARELLTETIALSSEVGANRSRGVATLNLGRAEQEQGNIPSAIELYRRALVMFKDQGEKAAIASGLEGLGGAFVELGEAAEGVRLLGVAHRIRGAACAPLTDVERARLERFHEKGRSSLGEAFESAWNSGHRAPVEEVVASVIGEA